MRGTAPGSPETGARSAGVRQAVHGCARGPERQTFDAQNFDAVILCYLAAVAAGGTDGQDMAKELVGHHRSGRRRSTPGSSCPTRSRRSRTARTSTTRAHPARSTSTRTVTRPRASTTSTVQGRRGRIFGETPVETPGASPTRSDSRPRRPGPRAPAAYVWRLVRSACSSVRCRRGRARRPSRRSSSSWPVPSKRVLAEVEDVAAVDIASARRAFCSTITIVTPARLIVGDLLEDRLDEGRREPGRGLVEQQHLWVGHQRARHRDHLALPAAHRARRLAAALAEPREQLVHRASIRSVVREPVQRPDLEVLLDRQAREHVVELRHVAHAAAGDRVGLGAGDVVAAEHDLAARAASAARRSS